MRAIFLITTIFLSTFATAHAYPRPRIGEQYTAELTRFQLDRNIPLHLAARDGAVSVDLRNARIDLSIGTGYMTFPENPRSAEYSFYSEFNLTDSYRDQCGTVIYKGEHALELRPPYSVVRAIEIRDNTQNRCPSFVPLEPTEVTVTDIERSRGYSRTTATSKMWGEALL